MPRPEHIAIDSQKLAELRRLVREGEGLHLEFKRKASFPDKIARELIAFANTDGGTLLVGVDDDGALAGLKFPEEELLVIEKELEAHCRPILPMTSQVIRVSENRFVLRLEVTRSERRPHRYVADEKRTAFVREKDQTIRASREMTEVIRRLKSSKGTRFSYGEAEQKLIRFLAENPHISLSQFAQLAGLKRFLASRTLIRLVLANVLKITPTEKGDLFSRA